MTTKTEQREVPADALQFDAVELQFAATEEKPADGVYPFTMRARSSEPIEHWYWGRIVHDMAGMQLRKESCPIDYRHSEYEIIGYGNTFEASDDGLTISGGLTSLHDKDRAFEVATKGAMGVPYEASIDWRGHGIRIEEFGEGAKAEVNGKTFDGPLVVVREWPLRAAAITPYGADSDTRTQFSESNTPDDDPERVTVCMFSESGETTVSKDTPATPSDAPEAAQQHSDKPAATPAVTSAEKPAVGISTETLKQFGDAFGNKAMEYLQAGLTFDAATVAHKDHEIAQLKDELKQLKDQQQQSSDDEGTAAETLKQFGDKVLGEESPVESGGKPNDGKCQFSDFFKPRQ